MMMASLPSIPAISLNLLALNAAITTTCHAAHIASSAPLNLDDRRGDGGVGTSSHRDLKRIRGRRSMGCGDGEGGSASRSRSPERRALHDQLARDYDDYVRHKQRMSLFRKLVASSGAVFLQELPSGEFSSMENKRSIRRALEGIDGGDDRCQSRRWHPDVTSSDLVCTNSLDYPSFWDDPSYFQSVMFDTAEDCCDTLTEGMDYSYGACTMKNDCVVLAKDGEGGARTTGCEGRSWHLSTKDGRSWYVLQDIDSAEDAS